MNFRISYLFLWKTSLISTPPYTVVIVKVLPSSEMLKVEVILPGVGGGQLLVILYNDNWLSETESLPWIEQTAVVDTNESF